MEIPAILAKLESCEEGVFPREALQSAIDQRDRITPELLRIVHRVADDPQLLEEESNYRTYMYALFLLAQFREKAAYAPIVQFFSNRDERLLDMTGDLVAEDLHRLLAAVSLGDDSLIRELVEDPEVNGFVRDAAVRSLVALVAWGEKSREELLNYFASLYREKLPREPSMIWDSLAYCSMELHPQELYPDIEQSFQDGLIELFFVTLENVQVALTLDKEETLELLEEGHAYRPVIDVIEELESWDCLISEPAYSTIDDIIGDGYLRDEIDQVSIPSTVGTGRRIDDTIEERQWPHCADAGSTLPTIRTGPKIGRNEPCPCGSGKKYKKCCGKP